MAKIKVLAEKPPRRSGPVDKWLSEIREYLYRLVGELEYLLTNIGEDNLNASLRGLLNKVQSIPKTGAILKGDGQGGVSAATPGTDYGTYSKPSGGIPATDMASGVQTSLGKADTAYQKPSSGIPSSDMTSSVQTSLGKANTAYQKPSGGIPATDMASGVQTSLGKADTAYQKPSGGIPASDLANGVIPTVPSAYTSNPAMDGTASPGSSGAWAKGDHVHPSDTSKAAADTISQTEATTTATRNYEVGDRFLLMLNGGLYRVTAPVSIGETLEVNTNCVRVTVGAELGNATLLYTNQSSAASFASQNIGLDNLAAYNYLLLYYKVEKSGGIYDTILIPRMNGASVGPMHIYWVGSSAMVVGYRPFTVDVTNSRLSCGPGYYRGVSAASATADDGYMIPIYIWGIKI